MNTGDAFETSGGHRFDGIDLEPWTMQRQIASLRMGLDFSNPLTSVYVLWLCTQSKEDVSIIRYNVDRAIMKAEEWAQERGINILSEKFEEGVKVFEEICDELRTSRAKPVIKNAEPGDDEPGEL